MTASDERAASKLDLLPLDNRAAEGESAGEADADAADGRLSQEPLECPLIGVRPCPADGRDARERSLDAV